MLHEHAWEREANATVLAHQSHPGGRATKGSRAVACGLVSGSSDGSQFGVRCCREAPVHTNEHVSAEGTREPYGHHGTQTLDALGRYRGAQDA